MITIGSLFTGIAGLDVGLSEALHEAGIPFRFSWMVEIDVMRQLSSGGLLLFVSEGVLARLCERGLVRLSVVSCGAFDCRQHHGPGGRQGCVRVPYAVGWGGPKGSVFDG